MMMSLDYLSDKVRGFLAEINPATPLDVTAESNLLEAGLLDSMSLVQFVLFIERTLSIEIPIGDFVLDSITSISSIYDHYVLGELPVHG
jgi:D-alanine--poly(phosphoribitol) ligase subunit 2